ncbi:cytochrome P450 [Rhizoctonia solani]|nr:cytochrome P450 [Rhizoctonia solani]
MGSDIIVVNSREAATELLECRWNMYNDIPHMVMVGDLAGWNEMLALGDYTERTKIMRKYMHNSLSAKAMPDWGSQQEQEAHRFLYRLLHSPENLIPHIRHTVGATVVRLTYGYTPEDQDDEYIKITETAIDHFASGSTPGAFMCDMFQLFGFPMKFVHDQMQQGIPEPSFVSKWLEAPSPEHEKAIIPAITASLYVGGVDIKELDDVVGKDRLPNFADHDSLPYVEALFGSEADDEYDGMRIPANSMVIANLWNMLRAPGVYPNPETFDPSRFLKAKAEINPEDVAFGFGRRRCPGLAVAHSSMWVSITLTLAAFSITAPIGEDGKPILLSLEYSNGTVR